MNGLMIIGTDTGVGKTTLCEAILTKAVANGQKLGIYKPVCTGSEPDSEGKSLWSDIERLHAACLGVFDRELICPQRFHAPLAPPVAASLEGQQVDVDRLQSGCEAWRQYTDLLLIEGVGGLLCPIAESLTVADLATWWNAPLIVVSSNRLGTISHTLLTLEVAQYRRLKIAGWVMNQIENGNDELLATNTAEIRSRTDVPFLGTLAFDAVHRLQWEKPSSRILTGGDTESVQELLALARPLRDRMTNSHH